MKLDDVLLGLLCSVPSGIVFVLVGRFLYFGLLSSATNSNFFHIGFWGGVSVVGFLMAVLSWRY